MFEKMRFESGANLWFTSDTHFGHANIIKFCNRPFKDVSEMNEQLIERWNSRVQPGDTVFHLGDFCFGGSQLFESIFPRLNGRIHLIVGNHDDKNLNRFMAAKFASVEYQREIIVEDRPIYLNHYPFLCYGGTYRNSKSLVWQLFGHVHTCPGGTGADVDRMVNTFPFQYDVGVDNNNWYPVSFYEVQDIINSQINNCKQ